MVVLEYLLMIFIYLFWFGVMGVQKINQKNAWELKLIDHLGDIIKVEEENNVETNFQKVCYSILKLALFMLRRTSVNDYFYRQVALSKLELRYTQPGLTHCIQKHTRFLVELIEPLKKMRVRFLILKTEVLLNACIVCNLL